MAYDEKCFSATVWEERKLHVLISDKIAPTISDSPLFSKKTSWLDSNQYVSGMYKHSLPSVQDGGKFI